MTDPTALPVADTVDVRSGPEVSDELLARLPASSRRAGPGLATLGTDERALGRAQHVPSAAPGTTSCTRRRRGRR